MSSIESPSEVAASGEYAPSGLVCLQCGYALKGLRVNTVCPECAYPVSQSLPGGLLEGLDAERLERVQASLGLWSAALIMVLVVWPMAAVICPQVADSARLGGMAWTAVHAVIWAVTAGVAGLAWLPLAVLCRRTTEMRVKVAAVTAFVCLWGSGAAAVLVYIVLRRANMSQGWLGSSVWPWVWLVMVGLRGVLVAAFIVAGSAYTLAMSHLQPEDWRSRRRAAWLAVIGAVLPIAGVVLTVPAVQTWLIGLGVPQGAPSTAEYVLNFIGAMAMGAACLAWAGACARVERCTTGYIEAIQAERLARQLEGTE